MHKSVKFLFAVTLLFTGSLFAQEPLDGAWTKTTTKEKDAIPYDYIREADVFWAKRIWRMIDVREKMNLPFKYPQEPLIKIIHEAAKRGEITVYDPGVVDADQFKQVLSVADIKKLGTRIDTVMQINPITLEEEQVIQKNELTWDKIVKFRVKEDWFFDEETSTMMCRVIGLAPIMEDYDASGNYRGDMTMYWVYYPDLRNTLSKFEVYNPKNDAVRLSWDDYLKPAYLKATFIKRATFTTATFRNMQLVWMHCWKANA